MRFKCCGVTFADGNSSSGGRLVPSTLIFTSFPPHANTDAATVDLDLSLVATFNPKYGSTHGFTLARLTTDANVEPFKPPPENLVNREDVAARLTELLQWRRKRPGGGGASGDEKPLLRANRSVAFQVHLYFRGAVMKVRRDESSPVAIKLREARRTLKSDLNQPVFFVYGNDKLLISAEGYLSRSSPWLGKGTQSLQPSDRPHFRRRRSHLFIWGSGNERMVSGARRVLRSGDGPRPLSLRLSD